MERIDEMRNMAAYIRQHASTELKWEALATRAYLSRYHFHREFRTVMGIPAGRYIREQKLMRACEWLLGTDARVTDIAYGLGFHSHDVFTRAFRQMYHYSPSGLRRRLAGQYWLRRLYHAKKIKGGSFMTELFYEPRFPWMVPFTLSDKRACLPTVELLLKIAETARREGILSLEEMVKRESDSFLLRKGIALICDGRPPEIVRDIMQNYILSSAHKGEELLIRVLILEGVLFIQAGENPTIICEWLLSLLGEDFYQEARVRLGLDSDDPRSVSDRINRYFDENKADAYPEGTNLLEPVFLNLDNRSIQIVLRGTDMEDFVLAFQGSSKKMQKRFCDNLSQRIALHAIDACKTEPLPGKDLILKAQHHMIGLYYQGMAGNEMPC